MADTAVVDIPLDQIHPDPDNPRGALRGIPDLAASIRSVGVLEPLKVRPDGNGGYIINYGHRRHAAAHEAEQATVPCIVANAVSTPTGLATDRIIENLQRDNLSAAETATAIQQLLDLGMDEAAIRVDTGLPAKVVADATTLAKSDVAKGLAERHDFTMDQALVFAEFDDDKDALKDLNKVLKDDPGQWDHTVAEIRQERKDAAAQRQAIEELTTQGVTVLPDPGPDRYDTKAKHLLIKHLRVSEKNSAAMTPAKHAGCPGHAAYVRNDWNGVNVEFYCTDWKANGHQTLAHNGRAASKPPKDKRPPAEVEAESKDRKIVLAGNKAWRAAEGVRLAYVAKMIARKAAPKGTLRYAVEAVVMGSTERPSYSAEPAKIGTDAHLPLDLFKHVSDYEEAKLSVVSWRQPYGRSREYLRFLETTGYALSLVEQVLVGDADKEALVEAKAPRD